MQKIIIDFSCLYEKQIFEIMEHLPKMFETYIIFDEITITKNTNIDKKFIKDIMKNYFTFPLAVRIIFNIYYIT